jgi:hypothetical protein
MAGMTGDTPEPQTSGADTMSDTQASTAVECPLPIPDSKVPQSIPAATEASPPVTVTDTATHETEALSDTQTTEPVECPLPIPDNKVPAGGVVPARRHRATKYARKCFIEALKATGNVSEACRRAGGFTRQHAYKMRDRFPAFRAEWDEAEQDATDALELEARRRAIEGVATPLVSMGKLVKDDDGKVIEIREYSDNLMALLLRGHRPERFRENINVTGTITLDLSGRLDGAALRLEQQKQLLARTIIDAEATPTTDNES